MATIDDSQVPFCSTWCLFLFNFWLTNFFSFYYFFLVLFSLFCQVQVTFVTTSSSYVVTDAPITVPTKLRRYGLSEVINHLLGRTGLSLLGSFKQQPQTSHCLVACSLLEKLIPFDFLIKGEFLRTSIQKYLDEKELSSV